MMTQTPMIGNDFSLQRAWLATLQASLVESGEAFVSAGDYFPHRS